MGLLRIHTRTTNSGAFFNGQADHAVDGLCRDIEEEGAEFALEEIRSSFHRNFKNPTGYYESHVKISNTMRGPVVNDGGRIAYGPWLEGVGSRNKTTRFKGYHSFRNAALKLNARIERIGEHLLDRRWIRRMQ